MNIVIVESAAKAKTINKYLGRDFKVLASFGHVRDLPSKDGSVEPDNDFAMHWDTDSKSAKILKEIAQAVKGADKLILATDPDREGEAISWHILQVLEQRRALKGVEVERVAFNAVTKDAIKEALAHPRSIDEPLVDAYLARRALDYLVGFTLSPVLWRKLPGSRSAGRVQSVALRLICDREAEIEVFKPQEYWTIEALLATAQAEEFTAKLWGIEGKKLGKFDLPDETAAQPVKAALEAGRFKVVSVEAKPQKRYPAPPFTTSTLQQEASRKLRFNARRTMDVAQKLYEGVDLGGETVGLITYMRTDGVQIVPEAIAQARDEIGKRFGDRYLPPKPRHYKTKAKNAQEAHEAVRPTSFARHPDDVARYLDDDSAALYRLIWQRAVASQMAHAEFERTTAEIEAIGGDGKTYQLRATGSVLKFDGFLKLYREGRDDEAADAEGADDGKRLPALAAGDQPEKRKIEAKQHFTEPPPRFTEATLVKKMEELGIGRPSTYASTLSVLRDRGYVRLEKRQLIPEGKGRLVTAFLESFFKRYVEFDFTADLEEKLDLISAGKLKWKDVLREFWRDFTAAVDSTKDLRVTEVLDALNELLAPYVFPQTKDGSDPRKCPACETGTLSLKVSRFGAFVGCSNYPECGFTRQFASGQENETQPALGEPKLLGIDPESGSEITLRTGRFGPYIQIGEAVKKGDKPKRVAIPKGWDPQAVDLEKALKLLSLPREIGTHPETGKMITANFGRYGPYVMHEGTYANLDSPDEVFTIGINRAVTLLAEKAKKGGSRRTAQALKELGEHPDLGGPVQVMSGRYGPYVKHGKINATLPRGTEPEEVTMEMALELINEKAAKSASKSTAKKKTATKKTATKKATAKKKTSSKT